MTEDLDDPDVEVVGGPVGRSSMTRRAALLAAVLAVLVGAPLVVHAATSRNSPPPAEKQESVPAGDLLLLGLAGSSNVDESARRLTVIGELVNHAPRTLTLNGPVRVSVPPDSGVKVLYAGLAGGAATITGSPDSPPPAVTHLAREEHVQAVVGLQIDCSVWTPDGWPTDATTLTIPLAGFAEPATYLFTDLFVTDSTADIQRVCS